MISKNLFWSAIFLLATSITANAQYCTPAPNYNGEGQITNVVLPGSTFGISKFLGCPSSSLPGAFENYTNTDSANVIEGSTYTATLTISPCGGFAGDPAACQGWIDWNQNGVYNTNESIGTWTGNIYGTAKTAVFTFTVPAGVSPGKTRLRLLVRQGYGAANVPPLDPCGSGFNFGSVQDYTINVSALPSACPNPLAPSTAAVVDTSALLYWTSSGTTFNVEYGPAGFTQGNGTSLTVANDSLVLTGLVSSTDYSYYVRNNCTASSNGTSIWIGPINFSTVCPLQTMPYLENFSTTAPCFNRKGGSFDFVYNTSGQSMGAPLTGASAGQNAFLTSPRISITTDAKFEFKWSHVKVSWANEKLYAYIREVGTTAWTQIWSKTGIDLSSSSSTFVSELVNISPLYVGKIVEIRMVAEAGGYGNDIFIDDFNVSAQTGCALPTNISFTNIQANTANINFIGALSTYYLEWGPAGFAQGTGIMDTTTGSPFTIHSLQPNTKYHVYLKRDCSSSGNGWTAWIGPFSVTTLCGDYPTTYATTFDTDSLGLVPTCWSFLSPSGNGSAVIYKPSTSQSLQPISGSKLVLYNTSGANSAMVSPSFSTLAQNQKQVEFWARRGFGATNPTTLYAGTLSNPADITTLVISDTIALSATWQLYTVVLNNVPAGHSYFAFKVDQSIGGASAAIEDVTLSDQPFCLFATNFAAANVTAGAASISWAANNANSWTIEYGLTGFSLGSGTIVTGLTSPTYALSGLNQNVCYEVYVTSHCPVGSNTNAPFTFCTLCSATAIPHTEDFTTWPVSCWSSNEGFNAFTAYTGGGFKMAQATATYWNAGSNAVLRTKAFNLNQEVEVSFKWSHLSAADQFYFYARRQPSDVWDTLKTWSGANFYSPPTGANPSKFSPNQMMDEVFYLDSALYYNQIVEFKFEIVATGAAAGATLFIDDFTVKAVPACPEPINFTETNITGYTATANWQGVGSKYIIEYGLSGFTQGTGLSQFDTTTTNSYNFSGLLPISFYDYYVQSTCGPNGNSAWKGPFQFHTGLSCPSPSAVKISNQTLTSVWASWQTGGAGNWNIAIGSSPLVSAATITYGITTDSVQLSGLNPASNYYFWVRDSCGPNDVSNWSGPIAFGTTCTAFPLNYQETFNGWNQTSVPICWQFNQGDLPWTSYTLGAGNMARFASATSLVGAKGWLISPEIKISDDAILRFNWSHMLDANNPNDTLFVLIKTAGAGTWNTLASYHQGNFSTPNATAFAPALVMSVATHNIPSSYVGQTIELAFYVVSGSGSDVFIDNVIVEVNTTLASCVPPTNVLSSASTQTSITVNWTSTGNSWQLSYGTGITNANSGTKVLTASKPYLLSGLSSGTAYNVFVRKICAPGDTSAWTLATQVNTTCANYTMPYVENFSSWSNADFLACWNLNGGSQKMYPQYSTVFNSISARADINQTWSAEDNAMMTSPEVAINQPAALILDWSKAYRSGYNDSLVVLSRIVGASSWDTVTVYSGSTFNCNCTQAGTPNIAGSFVKDTFSLPAAYVGQTIETALHVYGNKGYNLYIDKVSIVPDPAFVCLPATAVAANAITCAQATVTWQKSAQTQSNNLIYGPAGFDPAISGTLISGATSPLLLSGLAPGVNYEAYVEDSCTVGLSSLVKVSFTTATTPLPTVLATHTIGAATLTNRTVSFDASTSANATTYKWLFGDGDSSALAMVAHNYLANGTYTVTLFAYGPCGSRDTTFTVVIQGISVEESILASQVLLYPNPSTGKVVVKMPYGLNAETEIAVLNMLGQTLQRNTLAAQQESLEIDLSTLENGLYIFAITVNHSTVTKRVVLQR